MTHRQDKRRQAAKQAKTIEQWKKAGHAGLPSWAYKRTTQKKKR